MSGTFALCHVVEKRKNWSRTDRVGRRMPRGGIKKKGLREKCVEDVCPVPRGGCDRKAERACV